MLLRSFDGSQYVNSDKLDWIQAYDNRSNTGFYELQSATPNYNTICLARYDNMADAQAGVAKLSAALRGTSVPQFLFQPNGDRAYALLSRSTEEIHVTGSGGSWGISIGGYGPYASKADAIAALDLLAQSVGSIDVADLTT